MYFSIMSNSFFYSIDDPMFQTPDSSSSSSSLASTPSSSSSSSSNPPKKRFAAFESKPTFGPIPTQTSVTKSEIITISKFTALDDGNDITVCLLIDKGYHIRDDLNHPIEPFPIPLVYWTLPSRQLALASFQKNAPAQLLQGNGVYIASAIVEEMEDMISNGEILDRMADSIREQLNGVVRDRYVIKFRTIKYRAEQKYIHGLIALQEYREAKLNQNTREIDCQVIAEINHE
jgi:hypothetical protein